MNAKTTAAVQRHGEQLIAMFGLPRGTDPTELCRKLRRLERQAAAIGLRLCNGPEYPGGYDEADRLVAAVLDKVDALLHFRASGVPVVVNRDPRGYALKIAAEWMQQAATVTHDGKPLYTGTEPEAWLLRHQSASVRHALAHEGYAIHRARLHADWGGYGIIAPDLTA